MGLLDDAIREHLELKKRSGAAEEEVRRLETEAFGPARSAAIPPPVEPAAPEPAAAHEPAPEPPPEAVAEHQAVVPEFEPEPAPPIARSEPRPEPQPWLEDDPDEVPATEALDHPRGVTHQPTSEFTAAEAADAAGEIPSDYVAPDEEDAEDLLEETPDFLQETPEHDRLWFEQKPPRDFDFDE
jgi:hypothetical protein